MCLSNGAGERQNDDSSYFFYKLTLSTSDFHRESNVAINKLPEFSKLMVFSITDTNDDGFLYILVFCVPKSL